MVLKPWWNSNSVRALLLDLIQAELARLRPGLQDAARLRAPDPDLGALELDSLEFLDLATMVAVQFQLHETGHEAELTTRRRLSDWVEIILESRARQDGSIGFLTSGSTGQSKLCTHTMERLEQEIDTFVALLGDRRRLLRAVPSHHIYGATGNPGARHAPDAAGGRSAPGARGRSGAGSSGFLRSGHARTAGHGARCGGAQLHQSLPA